MDWIDMAEDRDSQRALVNAYHIFGTSRFQKMRGMSQLAEDLSDSEERLCSVLLFI
jgi:hypothetical protein